MAEAHSKRSYVRRADKNTIALQDALNQVNYGIVLLDSDLKAHFINRAFRRMWALSDEVADRDPSVTELFQHGHDTAAYAVSPEQLNTYLVRRLADLRSGGIEPSELRLRDGRVLRFEATVLSNGGRMLSYLDITAMVRAAEELERLSITDELTGLFNRRHFMHLAEREVERFRRYRHPVSFVMLDIDHFKRINDTCGTRPAIMCCVRWPSAVARRCERRTSSLGSGARNSLFSPPTHN